MECKKTLQTILERCGKHSKHFHYPHEGMERALRFWLASELFHAELNWKFSDIFLGEMFDMMLITRNLHPVVYVETKAPTSRKVEGRERFFQRIPAYGTIKYAIFTNGWMWEKYFCSYNKNKLVINKDPDRLDMNKNPTSNVVNTYFSSISSAWFKGS